jgi:hypothetical protein
MKKLKLRMLIAGAELLSREQMMQITGGFSWDGSGGSDDPECLGLCSGPNDSTGCDDDGCGCSEGTTLGPGEPMIYGCIPSPPINA